MGSETVEVEGLADLSKQLLGFADAVQRKVMRGALAAGARVVRDDAKANVPVAPATEYNAAKYNSVAGSLRKSIRVSSRVDRKAGVVRATVVAGSFDAYYARWVEFGTKPHVIHAKDGSVLDMQGVFTRLIHHPGSNARQFMRKAIDSQLQAATQAVVDTMRERIGQLQQLPDEQDVRNEH